MEKPETGEPAMTAAAQDSSVPVATGKVFLVGAGPGDPGLLTLKGKAVLNAADTVIYDRLIPEELLLDLPPHIRLIDAGKTAGNHPLPQEEINRMLIDEARQGRRVVRLKGGDPFLFGRGGEELLALAAAGIPFELVPGISSAIAVPAMAGIPVTHRGLSSGLHILTWRNKEGAAPAPETLEAVCKAGGTLVILMGGSALREIGAALIRAGFPPETPAAVIEDGAKGMDGGSSSRQRVQRFCLRELGGGGAAEALSPQEALPQSPQAAADPGPGAPLSIPHAPILVAVGAVCVLADILGTELDSKSRLDPEAPSLEGLCIVVTRPEPQNAELCREIRARGGRAIPFPCIKRVPLEWTVTKLSPAAEPAIGAYQWLVFTSAAGVEIFFEDFLRGGGDLRSFGNCRFAAVGPATAETLAKRGFTADYVPAVRNGRSLGRGLAEKIKPGEKVLLLRAKEAHPELPQILAEQGISFEEIKVYETTNAEGNRYARGLIKAGEFDYVYFSSAGAVSGFKAAFPGLSPATIRAVCFGESATVRARELGMEIIVTEDMHIEGLRR